MNPAIEQFIDPIFKIVIYLIYKFVITGFCIKTQKWDVFLIYIYIYIYKYIKYLYYFYLYKIYKYFIKYLFILIYI